MSEERVFNQFTTAMDISGISPILYRINDFYEDAVCIISQGNVYEVINFERNYKYRIQTFKNQVVALVEVIHRVAIDEDTESIAIQNFFSLI